MKRLLPALAALVVVFIVTACQPGAIGRGDIPDENDVFERAAALTTVLTEEEQVLVVNAIEQLIARCMVEKGWDYEPAVITLSDLGGAVLTRPELWLFDDVEYATTRGYGIIEAYNSTRAAVPGGVDVGPQGGARPTGERYEVDLFGTEAERIEIQSIDGGTSSLPGGGCLGESRKAIYDDIEQYLRIRDLRSHVATEVWPHVFSDRGLARALDDWRRCMEERGFEYDDPDAVEEDVLSRDPAVPATLQFEVTAATADATCKRSSELPAAFSVAFVRVVDDVLESRGSALLGARQFEGEAVARARDVVTGGG